MTQENINKYKLIAKLGGNVPLKILHKYHCNNCKNKKQCDMEHRPLEKLMLINFGYSAGMTFALYTCHSCD
jgi:hypothetical protein